MRNIGITHSKLKDIYLAENNFTCVFYSFQFNYSFHRDVLVVKKIQANYYFSVKITAN